ncbi:MAG: AzlD domain-containing protein [Clostridiales bacterium]|nr:AzlD domain-containing protein [Clostridiales bacterium]
MYILVMAAVTYGVRVIPLTLIRKKTENRFLKSFLYYVPYVTLAVMTFPAILSATDSEVSAAAALIVGVAAAYMGFGLFYVAAGCTAVVFILELFML